MVTGNKLDRADLAVSNAACYCFMNLSLVPTWTCSGLHLVGIRCMMGWLSAKLGTDM